MRIRVRWSSYVFGSLRPRYRALIESDRSPARAAMALTSNTDDTGPDR